MSKREVFQEIYDLSEGERSKKFPTASSIYKHIGISANTLKVWLKDEEAKRDTSMSTLDKATDEVDEALISSCKKGNSSSLRTYFQLQNRLVEKKEEKITIELSADIIARAFHNAREYVLANGYPVIGQGKD